MRHFILIQESSFSIEEASFSIEESSFIKCKTHNADAHRAATLGASGGSIYLELQNKWPFFDTKSSFFRGNSPFFLRFR